MSPASFMASGEKTELADDGTSATGALLLKKMVFELTESQRRQNPQRSANY